MKSGKSDSRCNILQFGEIWEKQDILKELEEIAKNCRRKADSVLSRCTTAAEREKNKSWRKFRKIIGFPLFNIVLEIARGDAGSELRNMAADILAHLWHPVAVDRLVEDIRENSGILKPSQIIGIFDNLAGIGNEVAVRGLISLWEYGWQTDVAQALAACNSKTGEAFLLAQAEENSDPYVRGACIYNLNSEISERKIHLLLDKLKHGEYFEQAISILKIKDMHLTCIAKDIIDIYNTGEDEMFKKDILELLCELHRCTHHKFFDDDMVALEESIWHVN